VNRISFFILFSIIIISCQTNPYLELERIELASGERYDSLFLGVKFGMSSKEFYSHCWDLNKKKLVSQGPSNNSVKYLIPTESVGQNIEMLFYPVFNNDTVYEVNTTFSYTGWAPWNKETSAEYLMDEIIELLSKWYVTKFYEIKGPKNKSKLYATINGNRRIALTKVTEREVRARFTDILIEKNNQK
tara:strand:+ start:41 stop:604 length:564 start_codon:yes stop_codon:yes gene_type:complete